MELAYCPKCEAFHPTSGDRCPQCGAVLLDQPPAEADPPIAVAQIDEARIDQAPPASEPPPATPPPPFEASPEVAARVGKLEAEIAKSPSERVHYLQLSQVYVGAARPDLAAAVLERFLVIDPHNTYVHHRLAQVQALRDVAAAAPGPPAVSAPAPSDAPAPAAPTVTRAPATVTRAPATARFTAPSRPERPVIQPLLGRISGRRKAMIGGAVGLAVLLFAVKTYLFPSTRCLVAGDFRASAPAFSPTGKHFAFLIEDGRATRLAVYDMRKGAYRQVAEISYGGSSPFSWSSDGTKLAYSASGAGDAWEETIFVVEADAGQPRRVAAGRSPVWSGGGTLIAVCTPPPPGASEDPGSLSDPDSWPTTDWTPRFCHVDVATGEVRRSEVAAEYGMAVSGNVERAVFEQIRDGVDDASGTAPSGTDLDELSGRVVARPAGNLGEASRNLAREVEAQRYEERRREAMTAQRLPYSADVAVLGFDGSPPAQVTSDGQAAFPSWTPDGTRILYAANGAAGIEIWTIKPDGSDKRPVLRGVKLADPTTVTLTRDGSHVFFVSPVPGDPAISKIMTGEDPADIHVARVGETGARRLENRHPFKQRFTVSPDGRQVVYEVRQDVTLLGGASKSELWLMRP